MRYFGYWMLGLISINSAIFDNMVSYITDNNVNQKQIEGSGVSLRSSLRSIEGKKRRETRSSLFSSSSSSSIELTMNNIPINVKPTTRKDAEYYWAVAGFTYCPVPQLKAYRGNYVNRMGPDMKLQKVIHHKELQVQVILLTNSRTKEIVVGFQGSKYLQNYIVDLKLNMVTFLKDKFQVHEGFKMISDALLTRVNSALTTLINHPNYKDYKITFIGHSLGGSVALLTILRTKVQLNLPWSSLKLITYGQPRTGNLNFIRYVNSLPFSLTRVVNQNDLFPHLPPTFTGYSHTYHELYFSNDIAHRCSTRTLEDPQCSYSERWLLSPIEHNYLQGEKNDDDQCTE